MNRSGFPGAVQASLWVVYVGLDGSQAQTSICVVDGAGKVLWQGKCPTTPETIAATLHTKAPHARFYHLARGHRHCPGQLTPGGDHRSALRNVPAPPTTPIEEDIVAEQAASHRTRAAELRAVQRAYEKHHPAR